MLVEVGADVELRTTDEAGDTALIAAAQHGHDQIVRMLLERGGADPNVGTADRLGATPLFIAARGGHLDAVKVLVEVGRAHVDLARTSDGYTPLIMAAHKGHLEIVRCLVQTGGADVNKAGHHGYTPANGILPLREAVAADLHKRFQVEVSQRFRSKCTGF